MLDIGQNRSDRGDWAVRLSAVDEEEPKDRGQGEELKGKQRLAARNCSVVAVRLAQTSSRRRQNRPDRGIPQEPGRLLIRRR